MHLKEMTLLGAKEYAKYKHIIPLTGWWWWLTAIDPAHYNCVRVVDHKGLVDFTSSASNFPGVRPACVFELEPADSVFWHKAEVLIGSKIEYGRYKWTILNIENGELHALCDEIIEKCHFDRKTNVWDKSELKVWLETEGLRLITA